MMLSMKEFLVEAFSVWTHKESAKDAADKHSADLERQGHRIMGRTMFKHDLPIDKGTNSEGGETHRILAKDMNGKNWVHSIGSITDNMRKSEKRYSKEANSYRVMRPARSHDLKDMKGKKY